MSENPKTRKGIRTSEFWLNAACIACGLAYASGLISEDGTSAVEKAVAFIAAALAAMGYTYSRTKVKAEMK
tara:strand:- start:118 stop:330 length:213 start_codon:yes stop_codon:yes gene_type:complete